MQNNIIPTSINISKQVQVTKPVQQVIIGKLGATYGLYGWIKLFSFTVNDEDIFNYQPWFIKIASKYQKIILEKWKRHNQDLILKIKNIKNLETATLLTNCEIIINETQLPDLDTGEFYWKDLLNCELININGYQLGTVINLIATGSNDVLITKAKLKDKFNIQERLIPFLYGEVIKNIDLSNHIIEVDWDPDI